MYLVPSQVQAAKAVVIRGVSYTKDQVLTAAQLKTIPKLSALISKNVLYTTPDISARNPKGRGKRRPAPAHLYPKSRALVTTAGSFSVAAVTDGVLTKKVTITISGGQQPYSINWGDSSTTAGVKGRVVVHTYATASTFTVTVTSRNTGTATTSATTT